MDRILVGYDGSAGADEAGNAPGQNNRGQGRGGSVAQKTAAG